MTTSHWMSDHKASAADLAADVVVVGAGYVGLSTAYWISEFNPKLSIIIVDQGAVGSGASGRNAGFLTKGSASFYQSLQKKWGPNKALDIFHFGQESLALVQEHIQRFSKTNSMTLVANQKLKDSYFEDGFDPSKFNFEWKDSSLLGSPLKEKFLGAFENQDEYQVHPLLLLGELRKKLENRKIKIIENFSAFEIADEGLRGDRFLIKASKVILALNGYSSQFHPAFKKIIIPQRAQMLSAEFEGEIDSEALHYDSPEKVYWRKIEKNILVIGGKRGRDLEHENSDYDKINPVIQKALESYLSQTLRLKFTVRNRWSGIMGFTETELPIVSKLLCEQVETYCIAGFSGHGMGFGFKAAQNMAELVTDRIEQSFFDPYKTVNIQL